MVVNRFQSMIRSFAGNTRKETLGLIGHEWHDDVLAVTSDAVLNQLAEKAGVVMVEVDIGDDITWKVVEEAIVEDFLVCLERVEENEDLSDMVCNVITFASAAHDHTLFTEEAVCLEDRIAREVELLTNQAY